MLPRIRREIPWDLEHYELTFGWHEDDRWNLIESTTKASIVVAYGEGEGYLSTTAPSCTAGRWSSNGATGPTGSTG